MTSPEPLLRRIRWVVWFFIISLAISGVTAIPLQREVDWLTEVSKAQSLADSASGPSWASWLVKVQSALDGTSARFPFLFYGTDWLAFGHFVIAIAFVGALRDPVRNRWLFTFGMIACALVIPHAMIFGGIRGIPFWWRLVDCSFGLVGFVPLWLGHKWSGQLEAIREGRD